MTYKPTMASKNRIMSVKKFITLCVSVIAVSAFITLGIVSAIQTKDNLETQKVELKMRKTEMQKLNDKQKSLSEQLEEAETKHSENQAEIERLEKEKLEQEELLKQKEAQLQAKANSQAKVAAASTVRTITGDKYAWMVQAGIPESDHQYANYIVQKESSWNPSAVNGSSGACGLAQALPCSKMGANWNDPVVALKWQLNYVTKRYGSYQGAYNFWLANGWY